MSEHDVKTAAGLTKRPPRLRPIAAALALVLWSGVALAQEPDTISEQAYQSKRAQLVQELRQAQDQLSALRDQRLQLESRIDNAVAQQMQRRTQQLLMSNEQNALVQLDASLAAAQENMLAQRDRMRALGDAVRRRSGAVLVVILRADTGQTFTLGPAELRVDNAVATSRSYTPVANGALQQGAVDQLYHGEVLPTPHVVQLQLTIGGQSVSQAVSVDAKGQATTYVQFTLRNGQLVPSTWAGQGTIPF
jgi:hypothetical protein